MKWALTQPDVRRVAADTEWENPASVRVLEKTGFALVGPTGEPGGQRFEYPRGDRVITPVALEPPACRES